MRIQYLYPLLAFVLLNVVVGYGIVIPGSCIAGWNSLTVGFGATIAGACAAYVTGLRSVLRRREEGGRCEAP